MAKKTEGAEMSCSFCGSRAPNKLIAGPAVFICDECVARAVELVAHVDTVRQPPGAQGVLRVDPEAPGRGVLRLFRKPRRVEPACSFCGNSQPNLVQPPSTLGTHALICGECLQLCQDIIAERLGQTATSGQ